MYAELRDGYWDDGGDAIVSQNVPKLGKGKAI